MRSDADTDNSPMIFFRLLQQFSAWACLRLTPIYSLALLVGTFITFYLPFLYDRLFLLPFTIALLFVCVRSWSRTELVSTGMLVLFIAC